MNPPIPPALPPAERTVPRPPGHWWRRPALFTAALALVAGVVSTVAFRKSGPVEPLLPPSPANPVYSHSIDIRDLGAPADHLVGGFSVSPEGDRMGIITTTRQGNPAQLLLCDIDGGHPVVAPTGDWEHRPPLWCSKDRIVTGTSRCDWDEKKKNNSYYLTVWDAKSGRIINEVNTSGIFFAGAVNPTNRSEVLLLPHYGGFALKDFPIPLYKWNIDSGIVSALPSDGLCHSGATWLDDGDILTYGSVYPGKSIIVKRNNLPMMLSEGDTVIIRLDGGGKEKKRFAQPIYRAVDETYKTAKTLLTTVQPSSVGLPHMQSGIWPIITAPVGAWVDFTSLRIIDRQSRFYELGCGPGSAMGGAAVSVDGHYIYFSKYPDAWVYDPANDKILKHWKIGPSDGIAVTPGGLYLLVGNGRRIDFYHLKPQS